VARCLVRFSDICHPAPGKSLWTLERGEQFMPYNHTNEYFRTLGTLGISVLLMGILLGTVLLHLMR
jgi:hypothetical protein